MSILNFAFCFSIFRFSFFVLRCRSMGLLLLLFITTLVLAGCDSPRLYRDNRLMMGTFVEVISPRKEAPVIVFDEFSRIESIMSRYAPGSEVSKLNKEGRITASPDLFAVVRKSKEFSDATEGAFDITVGPLVDLWGFTDKKFRAPGADEIRETRKLIGSDKIILSGPDNMIQFDVHGMKIDLGGIAKGYAVDCAVKELKKRGIKSCLINAGGQVYALGFKKEAPRFNPRGIFKAKKWRIAVKNPDNAGGISVYLELFNQSASTSADYEQYFDSGGKRYGHIMDPRTGQPAGTGIASVTVIAPDAAAADALSTACCVLGKKKCAEIAEEFPGVHIKIITGHVHDTK